MRYTFLVVLSSLLDFGRPDPIYPYLPNNPSTLPPDVMPASDLTNTPPVTSGEEEEEAAAKPRPVSEEKKVEQRLITPIQQTQYVVQRGGCRPLNRDVVYVVPEQRSLPCYNHPIRVRQVSRRLSPPSSLPPPLPPLRLPPAVPLQLLRTCDAFNPAYREMLDLINKYRRKMLGRVDKRLAVISDLCLNGKLMQAAKLQSDFQGLTKIPTHSGPRTSRLGSLEERLGWFGFGINGPSLGSTTKNNFIDGKVEAEELIYYWPAGPTTLSKPAMTKKLKQALSSWQNDPHASNILSNPKFQFFGFGFYQSRTTGSMYLTIVLATSRTDACNLCPDQSVLLTRNNNNRIGDDEMEDDDDTNNLFF